jgi:TetR/AcrR family transcriptional regulator
LNVRSRRIGWRRSWTGGGQILDAAFEEFSTKGFKGATIKSIAGAAGLQSPALIYWYFPDKEALFNAVLTTHAPLRSVVEDPRP